MQVLKNHAIGIDLGSSRFVIAVVKQGGVEIISNEANYRTTPCLVSYGKERKMGDDAKAKIKQNIKNSVFFPFRYLSSMEPTQLGLERRFNLSKARLVDGQTIFKVKYENDMVELTPQQVAAALFTKIKQTCEINEIALNDVVVSVPSYFTCEERQALEDSAKIAGVKLLRMYNESTANVMNYGIFRKSDLSMDNERLVGFIDYGHSKTSLFLAKIWKNKAEIIYEKNDRNLGVRNLDYNILQHYVHLFDKKNKIDLYENPKSIYRLLESIQKQRIVLSSNKISPLTLECIFDDLDLFDNLKIEDYNTLNQGVFDRFQEFVQQAANEIQDKGIDLKKIHSIERIGGGTRIPTIQSIVEQTFKLERISKTLDASESVSRGCAIQAAMISPRYQVQQFNIKELSHYPINLKIGYETDQNLKEKAFFKQGTDFNKTLSISIKKISPLNIELVEKIGQQNLQILQAKVEALKPESENFEGKVYIHLNKNGLVEIQKVELLEKSIVEEKVPKKKDKKDKKKDEKKEEKKEGMEIEEEEEFEIKKKERIVTKTVPFKQNFKYTLQKNLLDEYIKVENQYLQREIEVKETQRLKYELESYVYKTRDIIQQPSNQVFITQQEKDVVLQVLVGNEDWLYGEGFNANKDVIAKQYEDLQKGCSCFYSRKNKYTNMSDLIREATPAVNGFNKRNEAALNEASDVEAKDVQQKLQECVQILDDMKVIVDNPSISNVEAYKYEDNKNKLNQNFQSMNNVVNEINKRIKQREKEEREKREKEEKERKEKERKEKEEQEKKKKEEAEKNKDDKKDQKDKQDKQEENNQDKEEGGMEVE